LTPQWTPDDPKPGDMVTSELPTDLAEIIAVWPNLPYNIKSAIISLVKSQTKSIGGGNHGA